MATTEKTIVEIVETETNKVVKRLGPYPSEHIAEKADMGVTINLDHEHYFTRLVAPSKRGKHLRRAGR